MSFDEIFDLTAGVYFNFLIYVSVKKIFRCFWLAALRRLRDYSRTFAREAS